jgi:biopolymer transport protein ExbB
MKNMIKSIAFVFTLVLGFSLQVQAQDDATMNVTEDASANAGVVEAATEAAPPVANAEEEEVELSFVQTLKQKYIEGDVLWMTPVLICLIIGMALSYRACGIP